MYTALLMILDKLLFQTLFVIEFHISVNVILPWYHIFYCLIEFLFLLCRYHCSVYTHKNFKFFFRLKYDFVVVRSTVKTSLERIEANQKGITKVLAPDLAFVMDGSACKPAMQKHIFVLQFCCYFLITL